MAALAHFASEVTFQLVLLGVPAIDDAKAYEDVMLEFVRECPCGVVVNTAVPEPPDEMVLQPLEFAFASHDHVLQSPE